jgi:hypothetical protein
MATFNVAGYITGAVQQLLKEDPGGFKNYEDLLRGIRKQFAVARRRAIEQDLSGRGAGKVTSVAQLFAPGTRELQAGEAEVDAITQLNTQNEQMKAARRAEAERLAHQQLPVAYAEFQRKNQPSTLSKIAGSVVGGLAGTVIPLVGAGLVQKIFPNLFPKTSLPTATPSSVPTSVLSGSTDIGTVLPSTSMDPFRNKSSEFDWSTYLP